MAGELLIAEELFLLTHDDESGAAHGTVSLPDALAGALLLDLAAEQLVVAEGKTLVPAPGSPSHPLLTDALAELAASERPRSAAHWVSRLPRALKPIEARVGGCLVERGVLAESEHRTLGLLPTTRYVAVEGAPEAHLRERLADVLVGGATPVVRTALLVSLLHAMGLVDRLVAKESRKDARRRAKEISDAGVLGSSVTDAVAASVQAVQMAVITAAVTASTTATLSG